MSVASNQDRVNFTVKGRPTPWARAGSKGGVRYTPAHVRQYQDFVKKCAADTMMDRDPLSGPLSMEILFYLPIPTSWPKWKREASMWGIVYPASKPDLSNLIKAIEDACNTVVWDDDAQVVRMKPAKLYGVTPQAQVTVTPIEHVATRAEWESFLLRQAHVPRPGDDLFAAA